MIRKQIDIHLPYKFVAREYQKVFFDTLKSGIKRVILIAHRRWGKEKCCLNLIVAYAHKRVGTYYYFFPTFAQGRKILWDGMDKDGMKFLDHIPKQIIKKINQSEMKIEFVNGSILQIIGTDNYNSIVGTNPLGCVFSEFALQDPAAWDFMRPILAENGGWAIFNFTPRGENHAYDLYKYALSDPKAWAIILQTVEHTKAIPVEVLEQERKEIIAKHGNDAHYQQEYMCSFNVPIIGAYYSSQILKAYEDKRIGNIPYDARFPVYTFWDIGYNDTTAIWFMQYFNNQFRFFDYYEMNGKGLPHYVKYLSDKPYIYAKHYLPHDLGAHEWGSGEKRLDIMVDLGIRRDMIQIVTKTSPEYGIDRARLMFNQCWFDDVKCQRGLTALKSYHKDYDEEKRMFLDKPCHDWASNGSDAFRTFSTGFDSLRVETSIGARNTQKRREEPEYVTKRRAY